MIVSRFILILFVFTGCTREADHSTLWGEIPVTTIVPEVITWTGRSEDSLQFGQIGQLQTDLENHFYFSDLISQSIKKADEMGNIIGNIGRRGRGSGEFMDIKAFIVSETSHGVERLVISDEINRRFTEYSLQGEHTATYYLPSGIEFPKGLFLPVNANGLRGYLFAYKSHHRAADSDCLFHLFTQDFTNKTGCFGNYRDLKFHRSDAYLLLVESQPGNMVIDENYTIYFTPYLYNGSIYLYNFDDKLLEWTFSGTLQGLVFQANPIDEDAEPYQYRVTYQRKMYYGRMANVSLGLFYTPSGLRHFTRIKHEDGDSWYGMEKYDNEGFLEEYVQITGIDPDEPDQSFPVLHRDTKGAFYLLDMRWLPVIQTITIE